MGGRFEPGLLREEFAITPGVALVDEPAARLQELGNQEEIDQKQAEGKRPQNAPQQRFEGLRFEEIPPGEDPIERIEMRGYHESCRSFALTCRP